MPQKITKNTTLGEILAYPGADKILLKYNLPCLSCLWLRYEIGALKIGEVAKMYKLDLKNLLAELNKTLKIKNEKLRQSRGSTR